MPRIDKVVPGAGTFRATLNADYTGSANVVGVGLNGSGKVVVGAGSTGVIGVICIPKDKKAGDMIDVVTEGEIVNFGGAAGTVYTADTTTGAVGTSAASATKTLVGWTVEADRLIVRCGRPIYIGT